MKKTHFFIALLACFACKDQTKDTRTEVSITSIEDTTTAVVQQIENPSEGNSQLPRLFSDGELLYFSWVTRKDSTDQLLYTVYNGTQWQPKERITEGNDWFTNWADFPAIAANKEAVLTNHLQKSAEGIYTYDVMLNLFKRNSFAPNTTKENTPQFVKENFILHNDGTKSEHGFVSMLPYQDNSFFVTWLDGRNTSGDGHGDHDAHGEGGAMTLRAAVVPATGEIAQRTELDASVCDCCQTSAAMTSNGPIVAYRDRSEDEIRDISVVRYVNKKWSQPLTLGNDNWKIAGCPVNGPSIDAIGDSLAVAWFTASKGEGDIQVVFSKDAGETFTRAYRIDSGSATGRVDIVMLQNNEAAVLWMQPEGEDEVIYLMKVNEHGFTSNAISISKTSSERASGFPQVERLGDELVIAWTDISNEQSAIKMATVALDALVMPENAVPHHDM